MAKDCFIEKNAGVIEDDNLVHYNSVRAYLPNGCVNARYLSFYSSEVTTFDFYANKAIFTIDGVQSKHASLPNRPVDMGGTLYPSNAVSGSIFVDITPINKFKSIGKDVGTDANVFIDIKELMYYPIQELSLPRNTLINRDIVYLSYMPELTSFVSSRSKYSGSVESVVEKTIENYPTKEKSLLINLYSQAEGGGTVTFHGTALTVALYIEFNGDGTANVYNNTDHSTVIASYNGTTWTYA